jgi:hypothetical protein
MKPNNSIFERSRAMALRDGSLLDITLTAAATCIAMPSAVSPKLWRTIADDAPLTPGDPRAMGLCWSVFLFVTTQAYSREHRGPHSRTVWFETQVLGRSIEAKAIAHAGDHGEAVLTVLCADESDPYNDKQQQ